MAKKLNMILGGAQGSGLETTIQILSSAFASSGKGFLADREYYSNIKGRHSYVHAKISSGDIPRSIETEIDVLGCMDAETLFTHFDDIKESGFLIYDTSTEEKTQDEIKSLENKLRERLKDRFEELDIEGTVSSVVNYLKEEKDVSVVGLDYPDILKELEKEHEISSSQASRYVSSILIGAVAGLMDIERSMVEKGVERKFREKEKIADQNKWLIDRVAEMVKEEHGSPLNLETSGIEEDEFMMVNGNEATGMGKIVGGIRFQSYYPITPAADESFFIEQQIGDDENSDVLVFQTEDELAAINSCIGAALTGTRSATATSGPGFALMVEGLGWAGICEVPIVITYYQRGGPSTGQPTRGSQDDLMNALYSSHGSIPRIVLASGDHEEAFRDAVNAFNLAERYQTPVIHLLDKFLANFVKTIPIPDLKDLEIDRGDLFEGDDYNDDYNRFGDGPISPRAFFGEEVMWYTGSEHDEEGNVSEDPVNRIDMHEKRMMKLDIAADEIEDKAVYYGPDDAEYLIVGWGSVKGTVLDAIEQFEEEIGYLHVRIFSPFPSEKIISNLEGKEKVIAVEHSFSPRIGEVISLNTGYQIENEIVKYTGRPICRDEMVDSLKNIIDGSKREVLTHGP